MGDTDTDDPRYLERRGDVRRMFKATSSPLPMRLRDDAREAAARMFGLGPETSGPVAPGDHLGPYRIVRVLGAGGQAYVYLAEHIQLGRTVALKVPKRDVAERLLKEARMSARLDHPHMIRVEHVGEHEGTSGAVPYLVMEYLQGGSLDHKLEQYPEGMPLDDVRRIGDAILGGLAYAHSQGVIHRDVKPSNVLFDKDGAPKLADLGIGTLSTGAEDLDHSIQVTQLTEEGVAVGTPLFMAPEQENPALLHGESIDGRADLFSFGKMLFRMLTGANPRTIRPASRLRPGLDSAWDDLIFKLVEEDRELRYHDAAAVQAALKAIPTAPLKVTVSPSGSGALPVVDEERAIKVKEKGKVPVGLLVFSEKVPLGFLVPPGGQVARALFGVFAFLSLVLGSVMAYLGRDVTTWYRQEMWPLLLGSGLATFFLWRFRRGEQRAEQSIGSLGALVVGVLFAAWQPVLFTGRFLGDTEVGQALEDPLYAMTHGEFIRLGARLDVAMFVLGCFLLLLYRRRRRPPSEGSDGGPVIKAKPRGVGGVLLRVASVITGLVTLVGSLALGLLALAVAGLLLAFAAVAEHAGLNVNVDLTPLSGIAGALTVSGVTLGLLLAVPPLARLIRRKERSTAPR